MIQSDNSTVVHYIDRLGSPHSLSLLRQTFRFYQLINDLRIVPRARHIPGVRNVIADALSCLSRQSSIEWFLHPEVFRMIVNHY